MSNEGERKVNEIIATRFNKPEREKIIAEAERLGLKKMSAVIKIAVAEYFENHKEEIRGGK